jgi:hypothetical protein
MSYRKIERSDVVSVLEKWLDIKDADSLVDSATGVWQVMPYFIEKLLASQGQLIDWEIYEHYETIAHGDVMSEDEEKDVVLDLTKERDLGATEIILIVDNMNSEMIRLDGNQLTEFMTNEFDELYGIGIFGPYDILMLLVALQQVSIYRRNGRVALVNIVARVAD